MTPRFRLHVESGVKGSLTVQLAKGRVTDAYMNTNQASNVVTIEKGCLCCWRSCVDCSRPRVQLESTAFYTSSSVVWVHFTIAEPIAAFHNDKVPSECYFTVQSAQEIRCVVEENMKQEFVLEEGFVEGSNGMLSEPVAFSITHSARPLNLMTSWSSNPTDKTPLLLWLLFSVDVDLTALELKNYIVVSNGVLDAITFDGRNCNVTISPIDTGRIGVTILSRTRCRPP